MENWVSSSASLGYFNTKQKPNLKKRTESQVEEKKNQILTREWRKVLKWGSLARSRCNNNGILHGVVLLKSLDKLGDGRSLLTAKLLELETSK